MLTCVPCWPTSRVCIFSVIEAPRLVLLLFIENHVIPAAADGDKVSFPEIVFTWRGARDPPFCVQAMLPTSTKFRGTKVSRVRSRNFSHCSRVARMPQDSRHVLRALTFYLMELQNSPEFRQCSITDAVTYGRRLRAWQVCCQLTFLWAESGQGSYFCRILSAILNDGTPVLSGRHCASSAATSVTPRSSLMKNTYPRWVARQLVMVFSANPNLAVENTYRGNISCPMCAVLSSPLISVKV